MSKAGKTTGQSGENDKRQESSGKRVSLESTEPMCEMIELRIVRLGAVVLDCAKANPEFREKLRQAMVATLTDPEDMALFPEFFPPAYPSIR